MMEDSELWHLFRASNQLAYTQLVNRYYKELFNYGRRFCQDHEFLMLLNAGYQLNDDYQGTFLDNNKEVIFARQFTQANNTGGKWIRA